MRYGACEYSECISFKRYYDNSEKRLDETNGEKNANEIADSKGYFYRESLDNIHHWILHLFDAGMRTNKNNTLEMNNNDSNSADDERYKSKT